MFPQRTQCRSRSLVGDGVVGLRSDGRPCAATQHQKHQEQLSVGLLFLLVEGRRQNTVGNVPPTRALDSGEHRSMGKTIKCKSPPICRDVYWLRTAAEGPRQINWLWLFRERDGGRGGGRQGGSWRWRWRGDRRISLRSYHSLQSAGSAAVSKLELTGSAAASPPPSQ